MRVFGLHCEDEGHYRAVTQIVDEVIGPRVEDIETARRWQGRTSEERWYKYRPDDISSLPRTLPDGRKVRRHGKLGTEPELRMWRDVLYLFSASGDRPDAVVLCRDMDADPERRKGMEAARDREDWPFAILVAAPDPEIEAWVVSGFTPIDESERKTLAALRRELSFDPTMQSHRLTSRPNDAKTDAKRVLSQLVGDDAERQDVCLRDRDRLRLRGAENGLADFLDELERCLGQWFG